MANNNSGTPRKVTLDGLSFSVPGDANITLNFSAYETEGIPTTGETMYKMTLRIPTAEGIDLIVNAADEDRLHKLSERLDSFPISITLASGATYKTTGKIKYEKVETQENKATIVVIPNKSVNGWTKFIA